MMNLAGNIYLECADMSRAGISYNTLKSARARGTNGYEVIDDPKDRRRLLVRYDTLKPQVKAVVDAVLKDEIAAAAMANIKALVQVCPADLQALRDHRYADGQALPEEHIEKYARACAWLRMLATADRTAQKNAGCATTAQWRLKVITCIKAAGLDLPHAYGRLRQRIRQYTEQGATAVVSSRFGNQNSRKIDARMNAWLVSQFALPTKPDAALVAARYSSQASTSGWPIISPSAIYQHLMRPDVEQLWYLGRHGAAQWKAKYGHTLKNRPASFRDALWIGDGTKCNIYYQDRNGMAASMQMYIIMDGYSNAILGHSLGLRENTDMQYAAAKMALTYSQQRPMQWLYDGQSGHTSTAGADFYTRAAKLHFPSQPYNPKGKPIERVIGEFQKQVMRQHWAFTGQNITAKRLDSRPNMEFIIAHKDKLPRPEELPRIVANMIDAWNAGINKKLGMARLAAYDASASPYADEQRVDAMDMVELFWLKTKENTYRKEGIILTLGEAKHYYEVYDKEGHPDEAFRTRYLNARFVVRYDPENLDTYICLYQVDPNGDLRFITTATPKQTVARAVVDLLPGERSIIDHSLQLRERELERAGQRLQEHQEASGVDPEMLVEMAPFGAPKEALNAAEGMLMVQGMRPPLSSLRAERSKGEELGVRYQEEDGPSISPYDV